MYSLFYAQTVLTFKSNQKIQKIHKNMKLSRKS